MRYFKENAQVAKLQSTYRVLLTPSKVFDTAPAPFEEPGKRHGTQTEGGHGKCGQGSQSGSFLQNTSR